MVCIHGQKNIFITGVTGFMGNYFVQELLSRTPHHVYGLARGSRTQTAEERTAHYSPEKFHLVQGDITQPIGHDLPKMDEVWHLAGYTGFFKNKEDLAFKLNVEGLQNVMDFAACARADKFVYLSTAYVSGREQGVVLEDQLLENPTFNNPYEASKYAGELKVRESTLPYIILRPGIVMDDPRIGTHQNIDEKGVYGVILTVNRFLNLLEKTYGSLQSLPDGFTFSVVGNKDAKKNLIMIQDVVELMTRAQEKGEVGKTYHLTNPLNTTMEDIHEAFQNAFGYRISRLIPPREKGSLVNSLQTLLFKQLELYESYMSHSNAEYDLANTNTLLQDGFAIQPVDRRLQTELDKAYLDRLKEKIASRNKRVIEPSGTLTTAVIP